MGIQKTAAAGTATPWTVALATDRHFAELAGVLIRSLCAVGNVPLAQIVLFDDGLRQGDRSRIAACADRPVTFIDISAAKGRLAGLKTTFNWPAVAYMRILAPELIDGGGRMLYLDCDIVINADLSPLFSIDLQGKILAARGAPYFNSGVLLIDLDAWRRESVTSRVLDYAARHRGTLRFPDQDAINAVIDGRHLPLSFQWNLARRGSADFQNAAIIHFTGKKPDHVKCNNPAKVLYLHHRQSTPWANLPLKSTRQRSIRRLIYRVRKFVIPSGMRTE